MKAIEGKRVCTLLAVLLSLTLLSLFLAQCTADARREKREFTYLETARLAAADFEVPFSMVLAVIRTESDFRPEAVSDAGACGLMQLMPETFAFLRDEKFCEALSDSAIFDPAVNIRYGTYYLSYLYEQFGDWSTALAAYNAGEGRVNDWLANSTLSPDGILTEIPFPETAQYVKKALSAYEIYREKYPTTP